MDLDKAKGVIFGLAIGDALGAPTEFIKLPEIKRRYGTKGISDLPDPVLFTDDTQMSIAIAESLIKAGEKDINSIMEAVRREFIKWLHSPENNRAPGIQVQSLGFKVPSLELNEAIEPGTLNSEPGTRRFMSRSISGP